MNRSLHRRQDEAFSQEFRAAAIAMIAGFVDAYGMLTYNTYVSFMSGNTTQTGYETSQGHFSAVIPSACAIVAFVCGSFAGGLLARPDRRRTQPLICGMVAALLAVIVAFGKLGLLLSNIHIAVASFAMGTMNLALDRVGGQSINVTFVTGTLHRFGFHLAQAAKGTPLRDGEGPGDTHLRRALILGGVWTGFFTGALLSGVATPVVGFWVLLFPIAILTLFAALGPRPANAKETAPL